MPFRHHRLKLIPLFVLILGLFPASGAETAAGAPPQAPSAPAPDPRIDQKAVHDEYMNGNFETVVARIEDFQKKNPGHSREDSLFIARHLGVVLSADPRTAQAGKYWMHRLVLLSPDADLSGMYASEAIERTFVKIRKEEKARRSGGGGRKWIWIGAGAAGVAAGVIAWIMLSPEEAAQERTEVPVSL